MALPTSIRKEKREPFDLAMSAKDKPVDFSSLGLVAARDMPVFGALVDGVPKWGAAKF